MPLTTRCGSGSSKTCPIPSRGLKPPPPPASRSVWLFQGVALLIAFRALGHSVPVAVVPFVIPLGNFAGAAPLPGGLGSIEAAFVAILAPTTGIPAATVTAAVLITVA